MTFTLKDIIADTALLDEGNVIYAKKIEGKFQSYSEALILNLTDEEMSISISETIKLKCPGFDYFLETDILNDLVYDLEVINPTPTLEEIIKSVIHYVEFDA